MSSTPIAVVGGGIAGLTTAHALRRAGWPVQVFEQAPQLRATGAGITVQANAMVALESIGCAQRIAEAGYPLGKGTIRHFEGRVLSGFDMREIARQVGHTGVAIHRQRLVERLGQDLEDVLHFGARVTDIDHLDEGAAIEFDDGRRQRFGGVVGCDGLYSAVRRALFGDEQLRYVGYTTWRGIAEMPADEARSTEYWGPGKRFGSTPISDDEVYWFAVDNAPEGEPPVDEMLDEVGRRFRHWNDDVHRVLEKTIEETVLRTDTHDREPIEQWGRGCVTLLGDAAHPMTPNLGQGGSQAIEDAVVLGRVLSDEASIADGFRRYESLRARRANRLVRESLRLGEIAQWEHAIARGLRDFGVRLIPQSMTERRFCELSDFEGWYQSVADR